MKPKHSTILIQLKDDMGSTENPLMVWALILDYHNHLYTSCNKGHWRIIMRKKRPEKVTSSGSHIMDTIKLFNSTYSLGQCIDNKCMYILIVQFNWLNNNTKPSWHNQTKSLYIFFFSKVTDFTYKCRNGVFVFEHSPLQKIFHNSWI